jgi:site-specific recombinase XerD
MMQLKQASDSFLTGYFATNDRSSKTKTAYRADLGQFLRFAGEARGLASLDGSAIEAWAGHLRRDGYSPASIRRKMVALRVFCSYWVRRGDMVESPFWRVKLSFGRLQELPRTLTESETRALLAETGRGRAKPTGGRDSHRSSGTKGASSRHYRILRNLALVDILFATGMRVGEVSALDLHDFLSKEAVFRVHGKGGRTRLAFAVDARTLRIQRQHLEARMSIETDSCALFLNAAGGRLSTQGITNVIAELRKRAGIERHITPHMLRHTVATLLLRNGADVRVVQEFLGHASIVTTQRYTHITKEHLIGVLRERHPSLRLRTSA